MKNKEQVSKSDNDSEDKKPRSPIKSRSKANQMSSTTMCLLFTNVLMVGFIAYLVSEGNKTNVMSDCGDYFRAGYRDNGVYEIQPTSDIKSAFNVYCDMKLGGWTMIMKRDKNKDHTVFKRALANYKTGFGDLSKNHFLGLNRIHLLTHTKKRDLMFYVDDEQYRVHDFKVKNELDHYKLVVQEDIDQMPNGCSFTRLNNTYFSASDVDFDLAPNGNCSEAWDGGWWYTNCFDKSVVLTGLGMHSDAGVTKFTKSLMLIK